MDFKSLVTSKILLGLLFLIITTSGLQFAEAQRVVGYFPSWESGDINNINWSQLTDVIYFSITLPNSDGSLNTGNTGALTQMRDVAHANGVKISVSVGGAGNSAGFPAMASNPTARATFVSNVVDFVVSNNLDGVDINWETSINQAKIDGQDQILTDLANALHPLGKTVSVAINGGGNDFKQNNLVDYVNVMTYDMNWNNAEHSTLNDSMNGMQMYENLGMPKEKLMMGVPFYGRSDGWSSTMSYQNIISSCNPGPSENYCNGHWFNGLNLMEQKVQFVKNNNYGGIMIWAIGTDTSDSTSLLSKINQVLFNGSPPPTPPPPTPPPESPPADPDSDADGIPDSIDQCDSQKETFNAYQDSDGCPDVIPNTDSDFDGIPNSEDQCPSTPETYNGYNDTDGCPDTDPTPDTNPLGDDDSDGILNGNDSCPTQVEIINNYRDFDGCPDTPPLIADADLDGLPDSADLCPNQPETVNGYIDADGCPDENPIDQISESIFGDGGSAMIGIQEDGMVQSSENVPNSRFLTDYDLNSNFQTILIILIGFLILVIVVRKLTRKGKRKKWI